jgi:hypothetical protein
LTRRTRQGLDALHAPSLYTELEGGAKGGLVLHLIAPSLALTLCKLVLIGMAAKVFVLWLVVPV